MLAGRRVVRRSGSCSIAMPVVMDAPILSNFGNAPVVVIVRQVPQTTLSNQYFHQQQRRGQLLMLESHEFGVRSVPS